MTDKLVPWLSAVARTCKGEHTVSGTLLLTWGTFRRVAGNCGILSDVSAWKHFLKARGTSTPASFKQDRLSPAWNDRMPFLERAPMHNSLSGVIYDSDFSNDLGIISITILWLCNACCIARCLIDSFRNKRRKSAILNKRRAHVYGGQKKSHLLLFESRI